MPEDIYDKIMTMSKRRGFIFPSFEIYGGIAGFYDYGPLGTQLKNNVENLWRYFFHIKDNCIEINTPTITLYEVLKASGHVDEFTDLTVDCEKCKQSYKVEELTGEEENVEQALEKNKVLCPTCKTSLTDAYPLNLMFSTTIGFGDGRDAFLRPETAQGIFTNFHLLYRFKREKLPFGVIQVGKGYRNEISPRQGVIRQREFAMAEAEIFFDPKHKHHPKYESVQDNKLYLYDNKNNHHITLKKAVETTLINNDALAYYMYLTQKFLLSIGIDPKRFRFRKHASDELAHYATECWDAEVKSDRFGWVECVGIADRSAYDLDAHLKASDVDMYALRRYNKPKIKKVKKIVPKMDKLGPIFKSEAGKIKQVLESMQISDAKEIKVELNGKRRIIPKDCYEIIEKEEKIVGEKFVPHVIEPSFGIDRILYFILEHNYQETKKQGEHYRILTLNPSVAPIKVGVFPLIGDDKLVSYAETIDTMLRDEGIPTYFDTRGTIGRRYARMDEVGTPFCVTIDHDTLEDNAVTIRDRDTTKQKRIQKESLISYLSKQLLSNPSA